MKANAAEGVSIDDRYQRSTELMRAKLNYLSTSKNTSAGT